MKATNQLRSHFFQLRYEIGEELGHVLLLASVERLMVHRVHFAEAPWVVRLALALQQIREHLFQFHQRASMPIVRRALPATDARMHLTWQLKMLGRIQT